MTPSILKDLQQLVADNVISEETAASIRSYYQSKASPAGNRFATVLGILGALLVGLGIVLVVAHNWDDFGRLSKTIFAFLPLVLGQGLCAYTLLRKKGNFTWRESSSIILFFGVGACIALISQIYHLGGSLEDFLLVWMLLTVPLIYLMPSVVTGLLFIAGITWYAWTRGYSGSQPPYLFFPLLLLVVPAYLQFWRKRHVNDIFHIYNWIIAASIASVLGTFAGDVEEIYLIFLGYITLCCVYYMPGTTAFYQGKRTSTNPFLVVGILGILIILIWCSFDTMWFRDAGMLSLPSWNEPFIYITLALLLLLANGIMQRYRNEGWDRLGPVEFSAFIFLVYVMLLYSNASVLRALLINGWILFIALYYIRKGSMQQHLGILNLGLLIITALAVFRFFDESIPFVWRGIFFLVTGIGFFAANFIVIKRKRSLATKHTA